MTLYYLKDVQPNHMTANVMERKERLGREHVSTTLDIYSHLFPSKQSQVAEKLQKV